MNFDDTEAVGKRIKAARESFRGVGMQQQDLTRKLGYKSQSRLSYYELGKRRVPSSELIALAMILRPPYFVPKDYQGYASSAGYIQWLWESQKGVVVDYRMLMIQLALLFVFVVACGNRRKKD